MTSFGNVMMDQLHTFVSSKFRVDAKHLLYFRVIVIREHASLSTLYVCTSLVRQYILTVDEVQCRYILRHINSKFIDHGDKRRGEQS